MTDDDAGQQQPGERPVTTAERVLEAIRGGARTNDEIVAVTQINPSVVGIALTTLTRNKVIARVQAPYETGRRGPRPYVYHLVDP